MIRINDIEQGTSEWHETRYRKVGGSTAKGLFVKSDTLKIELLGQFFESFNYVEGYISDDMARGNLLEPFAVNELTSERMEIIIFFKEFELVLGSKIPVLIFSSPF
jgi:hypothetical protein